MNFWISAFQKSKLVSKVYNFNLQMHVFEILPCIKSINILNSFSDKKLYIYIFIL